MHLGLIPDSIDEKKLLDQNQIPFPVFEMINLTSIRLVMAAEKLKIFETLLICPQSAGQLAKELNCSEFYITMLLKTLAGLGYLQNQHENYALSQKASEWLNPHFSHYVGHYLDFTYLRWKILDRLEEIVKSGKAIDLHQVLKAPEDWQTYLRGLEDLSRLTAEEVSRFLPVVDHPQKLLDIGAGHGLYSFKMCENRPNLEVSLLDLPEALNVAKENSEKLNIQNKINFIDANILDTQLPANEFDYVFVFNLLHHFQIDQIEAVLKKIYTALKAGGQLVIWDIFEDPNGSSAAIAQMAGFMFALMSRTQTYPINSVRSIMNVIGFNTFEIKSLLKIPGVEILLASK